jgi:hypothetical protein
MEPDNPYRTGAVNSGNLLSDGDVLDDDAVAIRVAPPRHKGSLVMAAMLGLAQALGMEEKPRNVEAVQPAEPLDDPLKLDFGQLRPLDE